MNNNDIFCDYYVENLEVLYPTDKQDTKENEVDNSQKKGILYTYSKDEFKKLKVKNDAIKLFIVRKAITLPEGFTHIPQLSPSPELFNDYRRWRTGDYTEKEIAFFKEKGTWEYKDYASFIWWDLYEPRFLKEIPAMERYIQRICQRLDEGKDVYICCYCEELQFCHRRLVGEEVQKRGYVVEFH